jgi:hypothetical protein
MLRLRSPLDDARGTGQLIATHIIPELYGVQPLLVAKLDPVRVVGLFLRNEEMPLLAVRQRDGHECAFQ